jgi:hypothetical protein
MISEITYDDVIKERRRVENKIRQIVKISMDKRVSPTDIFYQLRKTSGQWMDFEFAQVKEEIENHKKRLRK